MFVILENKIVKMTKMTREKPIKLSQVNRGNNIYEYMAFKSFC